MLDPTGNGITQKEFVDFLNECDLEEALCFFTTGMQTGLDVPARLPESMMFDPSSLPRDAGPKVGQIKYRDYGSD